MTYRLEITRRAKVDRDECFEFIYERSPAGALRWLDAFEAAAAEIITQPHSGEAPESADHDETIHQKLFRTRLGRTPNPVRRSRRCYLCRPCPRIGPRRDDVE